MKLFKPGKIGKLYLKNRIIMAPMHVRSILEPDGRLSQRGIDYFVARAKGGSAMVTIGMVRVEREIEKIPELHWVELMADSRMYTMRFSELAEAVHDYGAKVAIQLSAGWGRNAYKDVARVVGAVAPSATPCFRVPSVIARELTEAEIKRLVQAFQFSAEVLRSAGIDAIDLQGHDGYLLDMFTTTLWNKRNDRYGRDLEGRLSFPLEVIQAIKRGAGNDFPLTYRLALTHYLEGGREVEEGLEICRRLEAAGVDALGIDGGSYEARYWAIPPTTQPPGCMVNLAEMAKKVVKIPIITVGKLGYPELAEKILQEGKADFIALGRPLLADPEWPNKVKEGRLEDIRPCIGDNEGCLGRATEGKYLSCTVNPMTGVERRLSLRPAEKKKSVIVVGGGPAGLEACRVAALRGHQVTLWEKAAVLGGNLIPASVPNFKQDYKGLVDYLSTQVEKLGVNIELGKEAKPRLIQERKPEVVFIATGGTAIIPAIPGVKRRNVATAVDMLLGRTEVGERVVMIGGGLVGSEAALYLAQKGKKVTIIEILSEVMQDVFMCNRQHLLKLLSDNDVKILTDTRVTEIIEGGVIVDKKDGNRSNLEADTILLAVGLKPNKGLAEAVVDKVPEVHSIGDCVEPRRVINAIWEGFRTARLI